MTIKNSTEAFMLYAQAVRRNLMRQGLPPDTVFDLDLVATGYAERLNSVECADMVVKLLPAKSLTNP